MIELTSCKFHLKCLLNESQYINDTIDNSIKHIKSNKLPDIHALYSCQEYISKMKDSLQYVLKEIEKEYDRRYTVPTYKELPPDTPLPVELVLRKEQVIEQQTIDDLIEQIEYNTPLTNCPICNTELTEDAYYGELYCPHCGDSWIASNKGGI